MEGGVAIVTGGVSGLGEASSRKLLASGFDVVMLDMNEKKGNKLASELSQSFPARKIAYVHCDVTNEDEVAAAVTKAESFGDIRVTINSAGIGLPGRVVSRNGSPLALDSFKWVIGVNLIGTFNVLRLAAASMAKTQPVGPDAQRGVIVNVASAAAFDGQIGQAAYSASKAGVVGMTLPIARDLAALGIRVCTIAPGIIETPMMLSASPEVRKGLISDIPFPRRMGKPEEFASLVAEIVRNPYLNGETIRFDGAIRMPARSKI
mmetsp:Transcript_28788/g.66487  ORF Transcript_28788/g.66487 Transcript_28788/m.66487 type:complete len:263 (-) Transcript_28788:51-839(-)